MYIPIPRQATFPNASSADVRQSTCPSPRHPRPLLNPRANHKPSPSSPPTPQSGTDRLNAILASITSVFDNYQSPVYLSFLQSFRTRTADLLHRRPPASSEEIDKLEKEWWGSEVVAVWYGPRPGERRSREVVGKKRLRGDGGLRRDTSRVALYDDE